MQVCTKEDLKLVVDTLKDCEGLVSIPGMKEKVESLNNLVFTAAVIGCVSTGKTTIINALLGKELIPESAQAQTAHQVTIKVTNNSTTPTLTLENTQVAQGIDIREYLRQEDKEFRSTGKFKRFTLEADVPSLSKLAEISNVYINDTPGINESDLAHEMQEKILQSLNTVDLIIYVINYAGFPIEEDRLFIKQLAKRIKMHKKDISNMCLFIVNKAEPKRKDVPLNDIPQVFGKQISSWLEMEVPLTSVLPLKGENGKLGTIIKQSVISNDYSIENDELWEEVKQRYFIDDDDNETKMKIAKKLIESSGFATVEQVLPRMIMKSNIAKIENVYCELKDKMEGIMAPLEKNQSLTFLIERTENQAKLSITTLKTVLNNLITSIASYVADASARIQKEACALHARLNLKKSNSELLQEVRNSSFYSNIQLCLDISLQEIEAQTCFALDHLEYTLKNLLLEHLNQNILSKHLKIFRPQFSIGTWNDKRDEMYLLLKENSLFELIPITRLKNFAYTWLGSRKELTFDTISRFYLNELNNLATKTEELCKSVFTIIKSETHKQIQALLEEISLLRDRNHAMVVDPKLQEAKQNLESLQTKVKFLQSQSPRNELPEEEHSNSVVMKEFEAHSMLELHRSVQGIHNLEERFQFEEFAGRGASALVIKALNNITGTHVAVKFLFNYGSLVEEHPEFNSTSGIRNSLQRECTMLANIPIHPNICHSLTTLVCKLPESWKGSLEGVITELIDAKSLVIIYPYAKYTLSSYVQMQRSQGNGISLQFVVNILRQALRALRHCQNCKLVHRDIKPQNILLNVNEEGERIMIADFGESILVEDMANHDLRGMKGFHMWGSPFTCPPEVSSTSIVCYEKADIYALGVSLAMLFSTIQGDLEECFHNFPAHLTPLLPLFKGMVHQEFSQRFSVEQAMTFLRDF